ncbi:hypothetical protein R3I94_006732 [Phoxinus phoxinus]
MTGPLLLHLLVQAVLLYDTLAWEVKMPKDIRGLQGSCLVIPCSFSYTSYPPKDPRRVVWYQWVSKGYPLVYDPWHADDVIEKFRGKTDLYGKSSWDCSLLIKKLEHTHHGETLYAWIDPENVGWRTYAFYEVTSTIVVDASPEPPSINIYGGERMGETITITCSTFHTCPYSKPNIILNGTEGTDQLDNDHLKDGLWKITLTRTGVVKAESSTSIECSVTHHGGITVTATQSKSGQSTFHYEADKTVGPKTIWLQYLVPSLVLLLACILVGVIIYKRRHRLSMSERSAVQTNSEHRSDIRTNTCGNKPFSKPRMPSPKSEPKSHSEYDAEYTNMDELNMYGNI